MSVKKFCGDRRRSKRRAAFVLSVAIASVVPGMSAFAQADGTSVAQATTREFNIAPQALDSALIEFSRQSGLQISAETAVIAGRRTAGVSGQMTPDQALGQLLSGTGVVYRRAGTMLVVETPQSTGAGPTQLDPLQVQGVVPVPSQAMIGNPPPPYAGGLVARGGRVGDLGNRDYMDTPFSTTVYTDKYIQDNQARTIVDALADDPTIRPTYGQGVYDDRMTIRGFYLDPIDMSFNGLYGINPLTSVNLAGIERIEVFRGPSALLSGMSPLSAIGGTINLVPKRAPETPIAQGTMLYALNGQFGGQIDWGRRFGPDNNVGLRINGFFSAGNTAVANNSDRLAALTLGFDFRGENTRVDLDLGYQNRLIVGSKGGTYLDPSLKVPPAPNAQGNFYQPWEFYATNDLYGMVRIEHDVTPGLTAFLKFGGLVSNGAFLLGFPTIVDNSGNTTASPMKYLDSARSLSAETGARGRFETGPLSHEAVLSGAFLKIDRGSATNFAAEVASNIYSPITQPAPDLAGFPLGALPASTTVQKSIGLIDAISFAQKRVQLIGGVRLQQIQVSNYDGSPGYDESVATPSISLVLKPWSFLSLYGNYIEALEQGPVAGPELANAGRVFAPYVSRQFEVGAKLDLGNFGAMLSAFQITQPQSFVDPLTNSLAVDGQQRNRGIEFTVFGEPLPGLRPLGGFTVLDAIQTSTLDGINNGKYAPGVPTFQANLGLDWDTPFLRGLTLSGRLIYSASAYIDPENTQAVPAWARVDLGARYTFERAGGKPISLRANVLNVANNNYWMAANGYLSQGQPRTFLLSLVSDF